MSVYIFVLETPFNGSVGIKVKQQTGEFGPCLFECRKNNQVSWSKVILFWEKRELGEAGSRKQVLLDFIYDSCLGSVLVSFLVGKEGRC